MFTDARTATSVDLFDELIDRRNSMANHGQPRHRRDHTGYGSGNEDGGEEGAILTALVHTVEMMSSVERNSAAPEIGNRDTAPVEHRSSSTAWSEFIPPWQRP